MFAKLNLCRSIHYWRIKLAKLCIPCHNMCYTCVTEEVKKRKKGSGVQLSVNSWACLACSGNDLMMTIWQNHDTCGGDAACGVNGSSSRETRRRILEDFFFFLTWKLNKMRRQSQRRRSSTFRRSFHLFTATSVSKVELQLPLHCHWTLSLYQQTHDKRGEKAQTACRPPAHDSHRVFV